MARKFEIDTSIAANIKSAASDSFKDNIKMIAVSKIQPSIENFYSISEIEMLADDIERQGLKHNLVVCENKDKPDTYFLKSGHRRFTAIQYLISENRYNSGFVPCLIDGIKTKAENMLDIIMLNATTRIMSDAENFKQYEILKDTIDELNKEGKKVKGRLREKVAAMLDISPAQVGKIENIKHNAISEIHDAVENGNMSIATADCIAKLTEAQQQEIINEKDISRITTKDVKKQTFSDIPAQINKSHSVINEKANNDDYRRILLELADDFTEKISRASSRSDMNNAVNFFKTQISKIKTEVE